MNIRRALLLCSCLPLLGCGGPSIFINQDPSADFGQYRTFGFPERFGTDDGDYTSLLSQYLAKATARELEARGYTKADDPDLIVNFFVQTKEKIKTTESPSGYYHYRPYDAWYGYASYETRVTQYTEGTLNIDIIDRRSNRLVWEAAVIGRVTDRVREDLEGAADRAVAEVFTRYPHTAGSGAPRSTGRAEAPRTLADYERLAQAGDADAQFLLGAVYQRGLEGVEPDPAAAARWYGRAAAQGHAGAQSKLGLLCLEGAGVPQDDLQAATWLERAAGQGVAEAQYALGRLCMSGRGVARSDTAALMWIARAADQGLAQAQTDLGLMHLQGRGVEPDLEQAFAWFSRAAEQGDGRAQEKLGMMYEHGRGVVADDVAAYMWYSLGATAGQRGAGERRDLIAKSMQPADVTRAEERAQAWIETHAGQAR